MTNNVLDFSASSQSVILTAFNLQNSIHVIKLKETVSQRCTTGNFGMNLKHLYLYSVPMVHCTS